MWLLHLRDFCENSNDNKNDLYIDMSDFYVEDWEDIVRHQKPLNINWLDVTVLDLFNIPYEDDASIEKFIKEKLWIDINTDEWIQKINYLFQKSIEFYEDRYIKSLPKKIKYKKFKNKKSVISFLKETKTNKRIWILNCAIAKVAFSIDDILKNEKIKRADLLEENFVRDYINPFFQIKREFIDNWWNDLKRWNVFIENNWVRKNIEFTLVLRLKKEPSIIWKQISDPMYYTTDSFKDLIWATFYVDNEEDLILLMKYVWDVIYLDNFTISDKNWVSIDSLNNLKIADCNFKEKILKELKKTDSTKKDTTYSEYKEIKFKWNTLNSLEDSSKSSKVPIWTEIKFVINWQDNEKWLSFHPVYDYLKRFKELTRLWIPIRKIDIINYVNDFFDKLDYNLKKKNKKKSLYLEELLDSFIKEWFEKPFDDIEKARFLNSKDVEKKLAKLLYLYFESKLEKVRLKNTKKQFYVYGRALKLQNIWFYRKDIEKV